MNKKVHIYLFVSEVFKVFKLDIADIIMELNFLGKNNI